MPPKKKKGWTGLDWTDGKLAGCAVVAHMRDMHRVLGRRDDGLPLRADQAVNEAGEARFFARRRGLGVLAVVREALGAHEADVCHPAGLGPFQRGGIHGAAVAS